MKAIKKSRKLDEVCYEIRGPALERAKQMEEEHRLPDRHVPEATREACFAL